MERLELLRKGETPYRFILGGGDFEVGRQTLRFSGSSIHYDRVPNSFLIDCCRNVRIQGFERFVISLLPYSTNDDNLNDKRKTWRRIGGYELDIVYTEYIFDKDMNLIEQK